MIVVADSSPIHYLVLIRQVEVLYELYGEVAIPATVQAELSRIQTPVEVHKWIGRPPKWVRVLVPDSTDDLRMAALDAGERDALALAVQLHANLVLVDERSARLVAQQLGLNVAGTLRVLADGAEKNLLHLPDVLGALRATNFRVDPKLIDALLTRYRSPQA